MLYYFFTPYIEYFNFLNLFNYLTFRAGGSLFTAFFISLFLGPKFIKKLKSVQKRGQPIRQDGPQSHLISKVGTPTMGGMLILISLFVSILFWADLSSNIVWLIFSITILFGLIGGFDDYKKLKKNSSEGFKASHRLIVEFLI